MAEKERKEIIIEMKADLKNLLSNLKKMPGMPAKEARQMVNALEKEFKAANKAAKQAAKVQKQSMQTIQVSAKKAGNSLRGLRRQTRELGGSFNAMGDVITEVSPEFGQFAIGAELAGDSFRSFSRILATGNPILIGTVAAIVASIGAYAVFTHKTRVITKRNEEFEEAMKKANEQMKLQKERAEEASQALSANATTVNNLVLQQQQMTGVLSGSELAILKVEKAALDMSDQLAENMRMEDDAFSKMIESEETRLKNINKRLNLRREEIGGIKAAALADDQYNSLLAIRATTEQSINELNEERTQVLQKNIQQRKNQVETFRQTSLAIIEQKEQEEKQEETRKRNDERNKERQKQANERLKEQLELRQKIVDSDIKLSEMAKTAETQLLDIRKQNTELNFKISDQKKDEISLLKQSAEIEVNAIDEKINAIRNQISASVDLIETEKQSNEQAEIERALKQNILELETQKGLVQKENAKEIMKLEKQALMTQLERSQAGITQLGKTATATGTIIKNLSTDQKQAALVQFRISQGVNIAEIVMETAKNVVKVFPDPVLTTIATALGAAQAAAVATQSPPEFHMGGMINSGPDTQLITALKGEAILDRSTVRAIGGEQGLQGIGKKQNTEVIVRTPFKHFDNYSKVSIKRGGALSKLQRTRSIGVY